MRSTLLKPLFVFRVVGLILLFQALEVPAQFIIREGDEEGAIKSRTVVVPYAFSSETLGFGVGLGGSYGPRLQSLYYGTAYITDNGSSFLMLGGNNLRIPGFERLHINPKVMFGHFTHLRLHVGVDNPGYEGERAGSNESSADNYIEEDAKDAVVDLEMRYTLPWGHFRDYAVHTYITENGLLKENPSGAQSWNPLESGQSSILFRPYFRKQFSADKGEETLNFQLGYEHDNRDFIPNPHRGYLAKAGVSYDPDWLADSHEWAAVEGQIDAYIPLWDTDWSRQQTLAFSAWGSYSPTYDDGADFDDNGRPPYFTGPTLGGYTRLRGYTANRFHDKAAICYTAEYRLMPEWQPFGGVELLDPLKIRWWQIVGLVEVGRVAPTWDLSTLHSDMKYDFGVGLRGMFHSSIGRLDLVVSEEGFLFTAMLGQAF